MKSEITIYVRPLRHAYFILADDLERFIEVASFCCTQWAGINNLIIPVEIIQAANELPRLQIAERFKWALSKHGTLIFVDAVTDRYHDYDTLEAVSDQLREYVASLAPGATAQPWDGFIATDDCLHPLNIVPSSPIMEPKRLNRAVTPSSLGMTALEEATIVAAFGRTWPKQERAYDNTFNIRNWPVVFPNVMLNAQCDTDLYASVLNLTLTELQIYSAERVVFSKHFHIVVVQSCADLCWYWAMRAASFSLRQSYDRRVLVLTKHQLLDPAYFEPLVQLITQRRKHPNIQSNLDVLFHHDDDEIEGYLTARSELRAHTGPLKTSMRMGSDTADDSEDADRERQDGASEPLVFVQRGIADAVLLAETAPCFEYGGRPPTFAFDLQEGQNTHLLPSFGLNISQYGSAYVSIRGDFLDSIPCYRGLGGLLAGRPAVLERRLKTTWLSFRHMLGPETPERFSLSVPSTWDLYRAYFGARDYAVEPSDKMAYASGLIELAGGLEGAASLRTRTAYLILDALSDRSSKKLAQAIKAQLPNLATVTSENIEYAIAATGVLPRYQRNPSTFNDLWATIRPRLGKQTDKAQGLGILAELVRFGAVQRGYRVRCPRCTVVNWYGIGSLDEKVLCAGCLIPFTLPLEEGDKAQTDRAMEYSLNSLANRAMDQDVLPVLLGLLTLKTIHLDMVHIVPGMLFKSFGQSQAAGDFDFVYVRKGELYAGECKAGTTLAAKDINTMHLARDLGMRAFFFVSLSTFDDASRELVKAAVEPSTTDGNSAAPFTTHILSGSMLFAEEQLPSDIPR